MGAGEWHFRLRLTNPTVALLLQLERQLLASRPDNSSIRKDVDKVRDDVIEQALVMGDDNDGPFRRPQRVYPVSDDLQGIDVQARVCLVKDSRGSSTAI